jgi:hypothetical protein
MLAPKNKGADMQVYRAVWTGFAVMAMVGSAMAKTVGDGVVPAEIPPASYKANYYVDSQGCAFIRAGSGANVTWVPRANRDRSLFCNQPPTFARTAQPAAVPVAVAPPQATPQTTPVTTTTTTTTVRRQPQRIDWHAFWFGTSRTTRTSPPPAAVATAAPPAVTAPVPQTTVTVRAPGYYPPTPVYRVPNGATFVTRTTSPTYATVAPETPAAPFAPPGYVSLLDEANQPAYRGAGTPTGDQMMDLVWTDSMPRRLIDARTGRDVTAQFPQLSAVVISNRRYIPASGGTTTTRRPRVDEASPENMRLRRIEDTAASETDVATPAAVTQPQVGGVYVQVATFGVPANAERTLARFAAAGLPTAKRPLTQGGKRLDIVLIGPFASDADLAAGLSAARGAGFSDAFAVR